MGNPDLGLITMSEIVGNSQPSILLAVDAARPLLA